MKTLAIGAWLVAILALAAPAHAADAPRCGGATASAAALGPPNAHFAWRAQLSDVTPVRKYLARPDSRLAAIDPYNTTAVLVLAAREDTLGRCWLQVRLPSRPNGGAGWINAERADLVSTRWRIEVSRSHRTVTVVRDGRTVTTLHAVIGTGATPTPTGLFAIAGVWRNSPTDFLGSWILTLTAHSDVLKTFDGGDGLVALHGRGGASLNDPLGSAASHGCVRLANADIDRLVQLVGRDALPGTPVKID